MLLSTFRTSRSKSDDNTVGGTGALRPKVSNSSLSTTLLSRSKLPFASNGPTLREEQEPDLRNLNNALLALAEIFPDIRPDVFREMLISLSEESRLHVVADQLLQFGAKWIQGRWRISSKVSNSRILTEVMELEGRVFEEPKELVPLPEQFRTRKYKNAVKVALEDEFKSVSKTAIEGILAEQNYSYTNSRPVLAGLAAKSWRINFKALMLWKRKPSEDHFMIVPAKTPSSGTVYLPQLKKTNSEELDQELYETVLKPLLENDAHAKEAISQELAVLLNNADAKENNATYECECCLDDVAFESIAVCSTGEHTLCFQCVRNTVSAALYAQAWSKSIDHVRSAVTCFAPTASDLCTGCIPNDLTQRALLQSRGGAKIWEKFEQKLASSARIVTGQKYHDCPFCNYAEADDVYWPADTVRFKPKGLTELSDLWRLIMVFAIGIPLSCLYLWLALFFRLPPLQFLFDNALNTLARKNCLSPKFHCLNPTCGRYSCRQCKVPWHDPHKCNEKEEISLRTSIEAAKSAASKRVCPKCNLSFVKESGCNKMTCTCGYTMCYLCRQGLGQSANKDNPHDDHDYSHFCGHFRAFPGRCMQCEKCDLYREGNQEEIVRKAGETAEKEWRARQAKSLSGGHEVAARDDMEAKLQAFMNGIVQSLITC